LETEDATPHEVPEAAPVDHVELWFRFN
jgi:hypothetical protein